MVAPAHIDKHQLTGHYIQNRSVNRNSRLSRAKRQPHRCSPEIIFQTQTTFSEYLNILYISIYQSLFFYTGKPGCRYDIPTPPGGKIMFLSACRQMQNETGVRFKNITVTAVILLGTKPNFLCHIHAESEQRWQSQHSSKN